jgi:undecaprenyl-diphosphatase
VLFGSLGYAFGRNLPQLERLAGQAGALPVLLGTLLVVLLLLGRWIERNRETVRAGAIQQLERIGASQVVQRLRRRHPHALAFVARRFAVTEYLGLHLTLGLTLSLGALWLFGGIAEDVIHHDPLTQLDLTIASLLHAHSSPAVVQFAKAITLLGSPAFIGTWGLALAVVLLVQRRYLLVAGWIVALAGGGLLDAVLKQVFHRPRPIWDTPLLSAHGWSFPSGHAMGSLIAYGMLAYLLVLELRDRRRQLVVVAGAAVVVLLIGLSRLYLGVHYFSDVIGGYAAGAVWLSACISGLEIARRKPIASQSSTREPLLSTD